MNPKTPTSATYQYVSEKVCQSIEETTLSRVRVSGIISLSLATQIFSTRPNTFVIVAAAKSQQPPV